MSSSKWFSVDKEGLAKVLGRKGKEFAVLELIQNAWDAVGVTEVSVRIEPVRGVAGRALLEVTDDSPEGFADLTHAYTLFAESAKKGDPLKRGRFNLGEKLVLAISDTVQIATTTGTLIFDARGRTERRVTREKGSQVTCRLRMNAKEVAQTIEWTRKLIPPASIRTTVNGETLPARQPIAVIPARLKTEKTNAAGYLCRVERKTEIRIYEVAAGETATLYEMGIPVMETGDRWHCDVAQKIPLTIDREAVAPSFLRDVRLAVFNHLHQKLSPEDMNNAWVEEVIGETDCESEAVQTYLERKFTAKRVAFDPSDPEANKLAVSKGYVVVTGNMMSGGAWKNAKSAGAILPAGQVTPSPKPYSPDGRPLNLIRELTHGMKQVEAYARFLAREILKAEISVTFASEPQWPYLATYGPGRLVFNVGRLGRQWFDLPGNRRAIHRLLIHEFGHHFSTDHLSEEYHEALCRIGAELAELDAQHWDAKREKLPDQK